MSDKIDIYFWKKLYNVLSSFMVFFFTWTLFVLTFGVSIKDDAPLYIKIFFVVFTFLVSFKIATGNLKINKGVDTKCLEK